MGGLCPSLAHHTHIESVIQNPLPDCFFGQLKIPTVSYRGDVLFPEQTVKRIVENKITSVNAEIRTLIHLADKDCVDCQH
jgi:hypothetical protein